MTSRAVLFDLDGTLIDSAPDLAGTANDMRLARGMAALGLAQLRPLVGSGARGMIGAAFQVTPDDGDFAALRDEFLERYAERLLCETGLFEGVGNLIDRLDSDRVPWGIVTNKVARLTSPIVAGIEVLRRAVVVVAGDTTAFSKPHPAPLLEAARRLGVPAADCVYVGDDERDVIAGRAAGMVTAAACWGYLGIGSAVESWGADYLLPKPADTLKLVALA